MVRPPHVFAAAVFLTVLHVALMRGVHEDKDLLAQRGLWKAMLNTLPPHTLTVSVAEQGMKLLRFLECRLKGGQTRGELHKWIRTGQVRVNGSRTAPFMLLATGDRVRLPPFATPRIVEATNRHGKTFYPNLGSDLPVIAVVGDLLVLNKPGGLACQPGSRNQDSVSERLSRAYASQAFLPAPAHRLDRHCSGLVLAGASHARQRHLHTLFREGTLAKEYLAWVSGFWPYQTPRLLDDLLETTLDASGRQSVRALPGGRIVPAGRPGSGSGHTVTDTTPVLPVALSTVRGGLAPKHALSVALPVENRSGPALPGGKATLLLILLLTGRKHQIRVQLASRGFPLLGDGRYGGLHFRQLLLHAHAITLQDFFYHAQDGNKEQRSNDTTPQTEVKPNRLLSFRVPPAWLPPFIPNPVLLAQARVTLEATAFFRYLFLAKEQRNRY